MTNDELQPAAPPADWAIERAIESNPVLFWSAVAVRQASLTSAIAQQVLAHARLIEKHEQPPGQ